MKSIFSSEVSAELISRINQLTPNTPALWGRMSVDQMLAHCCVAYDMAFTNKYPKPNPVMRFLLKTFVKKGVVNEVPYKKNIPTAPAFIISDPKNFEEEKKRLIDYLEHTVVLGRKYFEGKESLSFGPMSALEWNNLFYKHLDHHLRQFGV